MDICTCRCPKDVGGVGTWMYFGAFNAGLILLLDYWNGGGTKREDIELCVHSVGLCEETFVKPYFILLLINSPNM